MVLRNDLLQDVEKMVAERGPMTAVVVTGDIAYSGKKSEYEQASAWLDQICSASKCDIESVYVCPGNHDVDREFLKQNGMIEDVHDAVRGQATHNERESLLMRRLEQPTAQALLYAPLREYNDFAARYSCSFYAEPGSYAWESDDISLNDGSAIRVRGLNSVLLSGPRDVPKNLFLGERSYAMLRHSGVEYLTICHHPPAWLLDGDEVEEALRDRSRIMLFGHEHDQRTDLNRDCVTLFAGAVNPQRDEARWKPGYNIIELSIETNGDLRHLVVEVVAREWQTRPTQFRNHEDRGNRQTHLQRIELAPWKPVDKPGGNEMTEVSQESTAATTHSSNSGQATHSMRMIVNRFFRLPISRKTEIVGKMKLTEDSDSLLPDVEKFKLALARAKERDMLAELWQFITEEDN